MKRMALIAVVLFAAVSLYAGGKECQMKNGKSVDLTGTIVRGTGEHAKTVFKVANSDQSYTVCHESKASVLKLGEDGRTLHVKGRLVSCDEDKGEVLVIVEGEKL